MDRVIGKRPWSPRSLILNVHPLPTKKIKIKTFFEVQVFHTPETMETFAGENDCGIVWLDTELIKMTVAVRF